MTEYVPSSGSCLRCLAALDLASVRVRGVWYCSPACAEGRSPEKRKPAVPESWLYPVPRRFYRKRRPTELR
jgi:hypothetical protein